jgi:Fic family protein
MDGMGLSFQVEANLNTFVLDVLALGELEGTALDPAAVRSSVARRLGMGDMPAADPVIEALVDTMFNATQHYRAPLTNERLFHWDAVLFPQDGQRKNAGTHYRDSAGRDAIHEDHGRKKVHFQAPDSQRLEQEMAKLLRWYNRIGSLDPVIKAGIVHLLFVTVHPFQESNGRIAGVVTDMQLCRADRSAQRFYSLSAQIARERSAYHKILERTVLTSPDITEWLEWFLTCFGQAVAVADETLAGVLRKSRFWSRHRSASLNDRQRRMLDQLLDGFEGKLTTSGWAERMGCSQDSAGRDINELVELGILVKEGAGGRSTRYGLVE